MTLHLLDSDAVVDYLKNFPSSRSFIDTLSRRGETLCTCAVVLAELYSGFTPIEAAKNEPFLASLLFLSTSAIAGQQAGEWRYTYARRGIQLATPDMLIAATAHEHGARLITANLKDFPIAEVDILPLPRTQRNGST